MSPKGESEGKPINWVRISDGSKFMPPVPIQLGHGKMISRCVPDRDHRTVDREADGQSFLEVRQVASIDRRARPAKIVEAEKRTVYLKPCTPEERGPDGR